MSTSGPRSSKYWDARVVLPDTTVNGKTLYTVFDSGFEITEITNLGAEKLGLKPAYPPTAVERQDKAWGGWLSEPVQGKFGALAFTAQFIVPSDGNTLPKGAPDVVIGWPNLLNNHILVFDSASHTINSLEKLPEETNHWLKLKMNPNYDNQPVFETPLPDGETGDIKVDTGGQYGVALPPPLYKAWRAAHPNVPVRTIKFHEPGSGYTTAEEAWADEINLGPITLTEVPVRAANDFEISQLDNFAGMLGLYALERMTLIIDNQGGQAYFLPNLSPGPPYCPEFDRPTDKPPSRPNPNHTWDWTITDNVQMGIASNFLLSADLKNAASDYDGARADYSHAFALDPNNYRFYGERSFFKQEQGDLTGALADADQAVALAPTTANAWYWRSLRKDTDGDLDGALADSTRAIELESKKVVLYKNRSFLRMKKGDITGALADADRMIELKPRISSSWSLRGYVKYIKGDLDGAIADFAYALQLDPKNYQAFVWRGQVRQIQGKFVDALDNYKMAIELQPSNSARPSLYQELLLRRLSLPSEDFAKTVASWNDPWLKTIGHFMSGDLSETDFIAAAAKGSNKNAHDQQGEADYYIGLAHLLNGDKAGAREFWQKCLNSEVKDYDEYYFATADLKLLGKP